MNNYEQNVSTFIGWRNAILSCIKTAHPTAVENVTHNTRRSAFRNAQTIFVSAWLSFTRESSFHYLLSVGFHDVDMDATIHTTPWSAFGNSQTIFVSAWLSFTRGSSFHYLLSVGFHDVDMDVILHKMISIQVLTHWPLGDLNVIWNCNFQSCFTDWYLQIFLR